MRGEKEWLVNFWNGCVERRLSDETVEQFVFGKV